MGGKNLGRGSRIFLDRDEEEPKNEEERREIKSFEQIQREKEKQIQLQQREKMLAEKSTKETILAMFKKKEKLLAMGRYHIEIVGDTPVLCYNGIASNNKTVQLTQIDPKKFKPLAYHGDDLHGYVPDSEYRTDGKYLVIKNKIWDIEGEYKDLGHGYLTSGENLMYHSQIVTGSYGDYLPFGRTTWRGEKSEAFNISELKFISEISGLENVDKEIYPEFDQFLTDGKYIIKGIKVWETDPEGELKLDSDEGALIQGQLKIILAQKGGPKITKAVNNDYIRPYYDPKDNVRGPRRFRF